MPYQDLPRRVLAQWPHDQANETGLQDSSCVRRPVPPAPGAQFPNLEILEPKNPSETKQTKAAKRKILSERSQARDPKRKIPIYRSKAKELKQTTPSERA